jgi:hypothetical protein
MKAAVILAAFQYEGVRVLNDKQIIQVFERN